MREVRNFNQLTSTDPDSRNCVGYAVVFNSDSRDLGGFTESILPTALEGVLERSDVLALLNHDEQRGVLARSKYGQGSLTLEVDDIGLRYSFEAPNTALGNELIEGLKRGDISTSSFAFTVAEDSFEKRDDGSIHRTIKRFKELFDVSPVYREAYPDTTAALRKLEEFRSANEEVKEEVIEEPKEEPTENVNEERTLPTADEIKQMSTLEIQDTLAQLESRDLSDEIKTEISAMEAELESRKLTNKKVTKMEKFSLIKTINDIVNNRSINETAETVINTGKEEMRKSGLNYAGQIQLPVTEERTGEIVAGTATQGAEIVATDKLNILAPLRNKMVLAEAGATFMTGLVGNVSIPTYSGSQVGWEGEIDPASNGAGTFGSVELSPKRLTAYIDVSKQFLNQDSVSAEEMLKADIVNALAEKLESTLLGDAAGTTKIPEGLFYKYTAPTAVTWSDVVDLEKELEDANVGGEYKFIVNPSLKAQMKKSAKGGTKSDVSMIMEGNEVDGIPVLSTKSAKGIALGNWADYVVAQWGAVDLTIDPYTQAANGCIRIVINAYFDGKPRRAVAFAKGGTKQS